MKLEVDTNQALKQDGCSTNNDKEYNLQCKPKKDHAEINKMIDNAKENHAIHWIKVQKEKIDVLSLSS